MLTGQPQGAVQIAQGTALQILNRKDMTLIPATITNVSQPHVPEEAQKNPIVAWQQGLVVTLTLQMGSDTTTLEFPVNGASASYPKQGWFISPDPLIVAREVEAMEKASEQALATMPWHNLVKERSRGIILQLDPNKRKEAQQAQEIEMLKSQIEEMKRSSTMSSAKIDKVLELLSAGVPKTQKQKENR